MAVIQGTHFSIDPTGGNGNKPILVSVDGNNNGRNMRYVDVAVKTTTADESGNVITRNVKIKQEGRGLFLELDDSTISIPKAGGVTRITGRSNAQKLTFSITGDETNPIHFTVDSEDKTAILTTDQYPFTASGNRVNGEEFSDDIGASDSYSFTVVVNVNSNVGSLSELLSLFSIKAEAADYSPITKTCDLKQAAGDPYLAVYDQNVEYDSSRASITEITLAWDDSSKNIYVRSNTSWGIQ